MRIPHRNRFQTPDAEALPIVHQIDNLLNKRVLGATTDADQNRALHEKLRAKRRLMNVPPGRLAAEARTVLQELSVAA